MRRRFPHEVRYSRDLDGTLVRTVETRLPECANGHPLTVENTVIRAGSWECVICERARGRAHYARKTGAQHPC